MRRLNGGDWCLRVEGFPEGRCPSPQDILKQKKLSEPLARLDQAEVEELS